LKRASTRLKNRQFTEYGSEQFGVNVPRKIGHARRSKGG
jgi:hypothetical protein